MNRLTPLIACVVCLPVVAADAPASQLPAKQNAGLPLLFHEDFSEGDKALARFEFTDPSAWKIAKDKVDGKERNVLVQTKIVMPRADIPRGPGGRAWIKDLSVGPFTLEARI